MTYQEVNKFKFINIGLLTPVDTSISHIRDFTQGNINNAAKDRYPLWNDLSNNNLQKPFMHGVVGPRWRPQNVEVTNGMNMIASPMPKPEHYNRIIASEYPNRSYSRSFNFDMPLREEVQQIYLPNQITRVTTERFDPRHPLKQPVETYSGTLHHNTGSANDRIVTGQPNFLEKSKKIAHKKNNNPGPISMTPQEVTGHAQQGINHARAVFDKTGDDLAVMKNGIAPYLDHSLANNFDIGQRMIIPVQSTNRLETPTLLLHNFPEARKASIDQYRDTPAGVRSLNMFRRLK